MKFGSRRVQARIAATDSTVYMLRIPAISDVFSGHQTPIMGPISLKVLHDRFRCPLPRCR